MADEKTTKGTAVVDESIKQTLGDLLNKGMVTVETSKTALTPSQQAERATLLARVANRCKEFTTARQEESKAVHAPMIRDLAGLYLIMAQDGLTVANKTVMDLFESVWINKDEPHRVTYARYSDRKNALYSVEKEAPVSRQYAQRWRDLGRWQALMQSADATHLTVKRTANSKAGVKSEADHYKRIAAADGIVIFNVKYRDPATALEAGVPFNECHNAWKNAFRPTVVDLRDRGVFGKHNIEAALTQVTLHKVITKVLRKEERNGKMMELARRQNVEIVKDPDLIAATIGGLLAGARAFGKLDYVREKIEKGNYLTDPPTTGALENRLKALVAAENAEADAEAGNGDDYDDEPGDTPNGGDTRASDDKPNAGDVPQEQTAG